MSDDRGLENAVWSRSHYTDRLQAGKLFFFPAAVSLLQFVFFNSCVIQLAYVSTQPRKKSVERVSFRYLTKKDVLENDLI